MTQMIANLFERQSFCNEVTGAGVAQAVRPMMSGAHTESLQPVSGDVLETACRNRSKRWPQRQEYLPVD